MHAINSQSSNNQQAHILNTEYALLFFLKTSSLDKNHKIYFAIRMNQSRSFIQYLLLIFKQIISFPWIINWILLSLLSWCVVSFSMRKNQPTLVFDFFSYNNSTDTITSFFTQQLLFIVCIFCLAFAISFRLPKISKLLGVFSFLTICSMYLLLFPVIQAFFFS